MHEPSQGRDWLSLRFSNHVFRTNPSSSTVRAQGLGVQQFQQSAAAKLVTTQGGGRLGSLAVKERGVLHPGRAYDRHGCNVLPQLNLCEGAGEGGA